MENTYIIITHFHKLHQNVTEHSSESLMLVYVIQCLEGAADILHVSIHSVRLGCDLDIFDDLSAHVLGDEFDQLASL